MEAPREPAIDQYGFVITPDKAPAPQRVYPPCVDKYPIDPITGFRTVRMFISSTFRDMHGERDFIARFVLPAINQRVHRLRVKVVFIDLRWGLVKGGNPLIASLGGAELCKPWVIHFASSRYGWDMDTSQGFKYPTPRNLRDASTDSVAVEGESKKDERPLLHTPENLLDANKDGFVDETAFVAAGASKEEFGERELNVDGAMGVATKRLKRNASVLSAKRDSNDKGIAGDPITETYVGFSEDIFGWVDELCAGESLTGLEVRSALDAYTDELPQSWDHDLPHKVHFFMYVRDHRPILDLLERDDRKEMRDLFIETDQAKLDKLNALRAMAWQHPHSTVTNYTAASFKVFEEDVPDLETGEVQRICGGVAGELEQLGETMIEQLVERLEVEFPCDSHLETIHDENEIGVASNAVVFEGRQQEVDCALAACADSTRCIVTVVGPPGSGKSTFMAHTCLWLRGQGEPRVVSCFVGFGEGESDLTSVLWRLCQSVAQQCKIMCGSCPPEYAAVRSRLHAVLHESLQANHKPLVVVLDGLDQITSAGTQSAMEWLTYVIEWLSRSKQQGLTFVFSCTSAFLDNLNLSVVGNMHERITLGKLDSVHAEKAIRTRLEVSQKQLDVEQWRLLSTKDEATFPLYIHLACCELELFGLFEAVTSFIADLPEKADELFRQVLRRLERELESQLVRSVAMLLLCTELQGLTEQELVDLLTPDATAISGHARPVAVWWPPLLRNLQSLLRIDSGGLYRFAHKQARDAVILHYLTPAQGGQNCDAAEVLQGFHSRMATYFKSDQRSTCNAKHGLCWDKYMLRCMNRTVFHLAKAGRLQQLKDYLSNLKIFQALYNQDRFQLLRQWKLIDSDGGLHSCSASPASQHHQLEVEVECSNYRDSCAEGLLLGLAQQRELSLVENWEGRQQAEMVQMHHHVGCFLCFEVGHYSAAETSFLAALQMVAKFEGITRANSLGESQEKKVSVYQQDKELWLQVAHIECDLAEMYGRYGHSPEGATPTEVLFDRMSRLRRAEAICEAISGSESVELLGEVLHGLAWAAKAACEASTAVEATFVKAKSVQSGLPLATTLDSLANHLMAGAQWDAARECLNQCVKIRSHQLMKYHPDNAAVHVSLGRWNQLQHLYAEAFAEFEQAAHIYAHAVGAWHVRAANAYHFLAEVLLLLPPSTRTLLEACRCSRLAVHIRCTHYAHDTVQVTKSVDVSKRAQCALLELLVKEVRSNVSALCLDDVTQDSELDGDALYEAATTIDFALRNGTQSTKGSVETENCARGRAVASCQKVADSPTHAGRSRGQPNETSSCALASSIGTEDPPVNQPATWDPNTCAISGLFSHGQRTAARFTRHIAARVEARLLDGLARAEAEQCSLEDQLLKSEMQTLRYQLVAACLAKYRAAACISNKANLGPARSTSFVCVSESRDLTELDLDSKIQLAEWAIESFGQQRESLSPILSLTPFYESSGSNLSPITTVT